ncbi:SAM-dependent methyltransferase [Actinomadura fulvescens]|uniref:SAM-dependent methyltransferase n=1 Tax=Actinomadura fulvescens TaxID=46160 RepID=A0ABN3QHC6_9ACTN
MSRFDDLPPNVPLLLATPRPLGTNKEKGKEEPVADPARMYNFYLRGKDNYEVDRVAAQQVIDATGGEAIPMAEENLRFASRAAAYVVGERGVRQVLDIGMGIVNDLPADLPTVERAVRAAADGVVLIGFDHSPIVLAHSRALRSAPGSGYDAVAGADLRDLDSLFATPELHNLIDLGQPILVMLAAVLHFITDQEDPARLLADLHARLAPGSCLVLSHACSTGIPQQAVSGMTSGYLRASSQLTVRTQPHILALIQNAGWEPLDPDVPLCDVQMWAPPGQTRQYQGRAFEKVRVAGTIAVSSKATA